jgi:hypothetical protein
MIKQRQQVSTVVPPTLSRHAFAETLIEPARLASIARYSVHHAITVFVTLIINVLLDGASKEALC